MKKNDGFTLVELLVVIFIIGLLLALSIPNYDVVRERARITAQKMNMHTVAVVIETYYSEHGEYGDNFYDDDYGAYFPGGNPDAEPPTMGKLPTNPWTGQVLDEDEFNPDSYDQPEDVSNTSLEGPNDEDGYDPGEMRYGVYIAPFTTRVKLWGLIGMDRNGRSIRGFDATGDNVIIFVLHN